MSSLTSSSPLFSGAMPNIVTQHSSDSEDDFDRLIGSDVPVTQHPATWISAAKLAVGRPSPTHSPSISSDSSSDSSSEGLDGKPEDVIGTIDPDTDKKPAAKKKPATHPGQLTPIAGRKPPPVAAPGVATGRNSPTVAAPAVAPRRSSTKKARSSSKKKKSTLPLSSRCGRALVRSLTAEIAHQDKVIEAEEKLRRLDVIHAHYKAETRAAFFREAIHYARNMADRAIHQRFRNTGLIPHPHSSLSEWASRAAHAAEAGLRWREQQDDGGFYDNCKLPGEVTPSTTSNDELLRPSAQVHQARIRKRKRDTEKVGTLRRELRKQSILPDFFPAPDDNQDDRDDHRNDNHHDDDSNHDDGDNNNTNNHNKKDDKPR
jgi:hypothetical protein